MVKGATQHPRERKTMCNKALRVTPLMTYQKNLQLLQCFITKDCFSLPERLKELRTKRRGPAGGQQ